MQTLFETYVFPVPDFATIPAGQAPPSVEFWEEAVTAVPGGTPVSRLCYDACNQDCEGRHCLGMDVKGTIEHDLPVKVFYFQ